MLSFSLERQQSLSLCSEYTNDGVVFWASGTAQEAAAWLEQPESFPQEDPQLLLFLSLLEQEEYATLNNSQLLIAWEQLYQVLSDESHKESVYLLKLPQESLLCPSLQSEGARSDSNFNISLSWMRKSNMPINQTVTRTGGAIIFGDATYLLTESSWKLAEAVKRFAALQASDKTQARNDREWSRIRKLALQAGAIMDDFLTRSIVLTPETLKPQMRKVQAGGENVVEIQPLVEGINPEKWLQTFDRYQSVQEHYDIPAADGSLTRVIVDPAVQAVLRTIKSLPGRRMSGERGQAFLRNPYAILGEEAESVIAEEAFQESRKEAEVYFYNFTHYPKYSSNKVLEKVELLISCNDPENPKSFSLDLNTPQQLEAFLHEAEGKWRRNMLCFVWEGIELDLQGDAETQIDQLKELLEQWKDPTSVRITHEEVYDFTLYSPRVENIGAHRPVHSIYIAKKKDDSSWIPEFLEVGVVYNDPKSGESEYIELTDEQLPFLYERLQRDTIQTITLPGSDQAVSRETAQALANVIEQAKTHAQQGEAPNLDDGLWNKGKTERRKKLKRKVLLIRQCIERVDYMESRRDGLTFTFRGTPELPTALKPDIELHQHQKEGVEWLQHLWEKTKAPYYIRGCVFADDMGLGKTLQLLTFMAWYLEKEQIPLPILIVAPVALLENWQREMQIFFKPGFAPIIALHGTELKERRLPRAQVAAQLLQDGIDSFLKPGWRGNAQIVLTTYEVLRDYEFSFSREKWSIMVCDEAQKIKTPGTLVTKAAKAQNALFKVACTGTPVENSLADLWCLFDFIQPGYLGALNDFGRRYRRPIETNTEEEKQALEELKNKITDQLIRRMKEQVATLPPKTPNAECRELLISPFQKELYQQAVGLYRSKLAELQTQEESNKAGTVILAMLHRLRSICAAPRPADTHLDLNKPLKHYCQESPKMAWLRETLREIQKCNEKAIIFTEFKDVQIMLQYYIHQEFSLRPDIINGSTKVGENSSSPSRQRKIDAFQAAAGFNVLILSPVAVGFGVNIQAANHVIHFTRCWNPAKEDQATDRAYRIGQKKEVFVYYPTIHSPEFVTFEKKLDNLLERKRALAGNVLSDVLGSMLNGVEEVTVADLAGVNDVQGHPIADGILIDENQISRMQPEAFERFCKLLWEKQGYKMELNSRRPQGGVDVFGIRNQNGVLIQCKTSATEDKGLGRMAVVDVASAHAEFQKQYPTVEFVKIAATNQRFNEEAERHASSNRVRLFDRKALYDLLLTYPVTTLELELEGV